MTTVIACRYGNSFPDTNYELSNPPYTARLKTLSQTSTAVAIHLHYKPMLCLYRQTDKEHVSFFALGMVDMHELTQIHINSSISGQSPAIPFRHRNSHECIAPNRRNCAHENRLATDTLLFHQ